MLLYDKNLQNPVEITEEALNEGLRNGSITTSERIKKHHIVPDKDKRPAKSAEELYNEMKANGESVVIRNGTYCKYIYNTYEAINPIPAVDDWDEYEEVYVENN